jgi:hypothetical protein
MKKIIRLTESDLMRIVKRVIREQEWSDEDEMGLSSLRKSTEDIYKKQPTYKKSIGKDYGGDYDRFMSDLDKTDWESINTAKEKLLSKQTDKERKLSDLRHSNVVKNRPSDYDYNKYKNEYNKLKRELVSVEQELPYLKDFDNDMDEFIDAYENSPAVEKHRRILDRLNYLSRHMGRDF